MDVLEAGPEGERHHRRATRVARMMIAIAACALIIAVVASALQWWRQQSGRPVRLEIASIEPLGPFAISGSDLPGGWPRGLVVGALRLRAEVTGDPQRTVVVASAGEGTAYVTSDIEPVAVPAAETVVLDLTVTPANCSAIDSPGSPLVDAEGAEVPMTPSAVRVLGEALGPLCDTGQAAPAISANSVRVDVFFRDRTLVMRTRIVTAGDRVVLQPRDSTGFRGGSEQEATIEDGLATARLRWLISPAEAQGLDSPTVRVRAFTITSGRGYPWVLDLRVPEGFAMSTPSAPRNDGVDLAEVAPRPSS